MAPLEDFINTIAGPVRSFPPGLRQTYAEIMQQFSTDSEAQGFDQITRREGFQDTTVRGVAHRMYWWLPTHFFKFQESLLLWEQKCRTSGRAFLLDRPKVTFVDLGYGAGAASAAVLATLEQYQCFCRANSMRIEPTEVRFIALDSVPSEVDVYESFVRAYAARIEQYKIHVDVHTICKRFPEGTSAIINALSELHGHVLIVGMSNLINWIWNEYDEHLAEGKPAEITDLSPAETEALRELAEQTDFDSLHVIGIAVKQKRYWFLPQKLEALFMKLLVALELASRPLGTHWGVHAKVIFENPQGSRHVRDRPQGTSEYFVDNLVDTAPGYAHDKKLHDALSRRSLRTAWAKVRCCMRYESLTDWVELKLFENDVETSISRLREHSLDRVRSSLNLEHHLPYQFPKNAQETRPRSLPRLEEQIVAAAVSTSFAKELEGPCPEVSYSYRLAPDNTEFLYEYWFEAYKTYLADALRSLDGSDVLVTDIKSYYVKVRQSTLLSVLQARFRISARCRELIAHVIDRVFCLS